MRIGERIKKARIDAGFTQKKLGELCGMADSAIRRYENGGANPKFETIKKIADALNIEVFDLLGGSNEVNIIEPTLDELRKEVGDLRYSLNADGLNKTKEYMYDIMGNPKYKI